MIERSDWLPSHCAVSFESDWLMNNTIELCISLSILGLYKHQITRIMNTQSCVSCLHIKGRVQHRVSLSLLKSSCWEWTKYQTSWTKIALWTLVKKRIMRHIIIVPFHWPHGKSWRIHRCSQQLTELLKYMRNNENIQWVKVPSRQSLMRSLC